MTVSVRKYLTDYHAKYLTDYHAKCRGVHPKLQKLDVRTQNSKKIPRSLRLEVINNLAKNQYIAFLPQFGLCLSYCS
jgi:hypothetical protein